MNLVLGLYQLKKYINIYFKSIKIVVKWPNTTVSPNIFGMVLLLLTTQILYFPSVVPNNYRKYDEIRLS